MKTPTLYQPTANEIIKVTASAKHRHPALSARIDKARDILLNGSLQLDTAAWDVRQLARWRIASQSHGGAYVVVGMSCPCQDSRSPVIDGTHFCKHAMAVQLYLKILRTRLNVDIRSFNVELGIVHTGEFQVFAPGMGIVTVARDGDTFRFAGHADSVRYSAWLAKQAPVAQPVHMPHSVVLAA